jgi:hypothetical protein
MFKQKVLIGKVVDTHQVVLNDELFERFVEAMGVRREAKASTHLWNFALTSLGAHGKAYELLELKPKQILHSRESFEIIKAPHIGDELEIETTIKDLYEQQAGSAPMGFAVISVVGKHKNKIAFSSQRIVAVRGGFSRR